MNKTPLNKLYIITAFLVPFGIVVIVFMLTGIYPFGDKMIAISDLYHQYIPLLAEAQRKLRLGGSLLFSWRVGGGLDFWSILAYQGMSPLTLILLRIFPEHLIVEAVTTAILLKIGFAGSNMYIFLTKIEQYRNDRTDNMPWLDISMSSMYALSSYMLAYYWNVMWLDVVVLLPLTALGLHALVEKRGWRLYTISLALLIICNYYIGAMVCLFLIFYYILIYFEVQRSGGIKSFIKTTASFVMRSLESAALSAIVLIPVFLSVRRTAGYFSDLAIKAGLFYSPLEFLKQLLPGAELAYKSGPPNIAAGFLAIIFLLLYFSEKSIPKRERIANGIFIFSLLLSMDFTTSDLLWNMFHTPNQLPYRYSFVFCFLMISLASRMIGRHEIISKGRLITVTSIMAAWIILTAATCTGSLDDARGFVINGMIFLALYGAILYLGRDGSIKPGLVCMVLTAAVILELFFGAYGAFSRIGNTYRDGYLDPSQDGVKASRVADTTDGFCRVEMAESDVMNPPSLYEYRGISVFSSSIGTGITEFAEEMGMDARAMANQIIYHPGSPVIDAIWNIGFIISEDEMHRDDLKEAGWDGKAHLYETKYPMSICYCLPEGIIDWDPAGMRRVDAIDSFIDIATLGEFEKGSDWPKAYPLISRELMTVTEAGERTLTGEFSASRDEVLVTSIPWDPGWRLYIDGEKSEIISWAGGAFIAAHVAEGRHTVRFEFIPQGFYAGMAVSVMALICLMAEWLCKNARKSNGRK